MLYRFIETEQAYDGSQLASLKNYLEHGLLGDSIVAWIGPCNVKLDHMVDGEDLLQNAEIRGDRMLHFRVELFDGCTLLSAVSLQRLLATIVRDQIESLIGATSGLRRDGDDLFLGPAKLSISIATLSPVSALIHFAVNITNDGTPVKTCSLGDLKVDGKELSLNVMKAFCAEVESIREATRKVKWVP